MDFVEGESLAARVGRGPMPAREALEIVRETAEKLIADCHKSPTAASAKASYNAGWSLYFALNDKEEREIAEGLESSPARSSA